MGPLSLTAELVARVDRTIDEDGIGEGRTRLDDAGFRALSRRIWDENGGELKVFAYGSLLWKPEPGLAPLTTVRVHGWRRSFCMNLTSWRGTPEEPGLMLALDRGGCCDGVVMGFDAALGPEGFEVVLRREIDSHEAIPHIRPISGRDRGGNRVTALAFYAAPRGPGVAPDLPLQEQARRIARAAGRAGSCAAYLHHTVTALAAQGIGDGYLWRLQALVAAEIRALTGAG